jgi:hypothetical protein
MSIYLCAFECREVAVWFSRTPLSLERISIQYNTYTMSQANDQTDSLAGSPHPLKSSGALDQFSKIDATPTIGVEFGRGIQVM